MTEFLTTRGASHHIEGIIRNAKNKLVLISPYLKLSETLFERLKDADRNNVKMTLVYGKERLYPDEEDKLGQLNNLSLYFLKNLHAKCVFNEEHMVITSMNLHEFSEQNNREMGVLITAKDDENVFRDAVKEAESLVNVSSKYDLRRPSGEHYRTKLKGYCIRCRASIAYDLDRPYCRDCFSEWLYWENPDYEESCCHTCGKSALTSMAKPRCYVCYSKSG